MGCLGVGGGGGVWSWNPRFLKWFHDWELEEVEVFVWRLYELSIWRDIEDKLVWLNSKRGIFLVKSFYSPFSKGRVEGFLLASFGILRFHQGLVF